MIYLITNQTSITPESDKIKQCSLSDMFQYFERRPEIQLDTESDGIGSPYNVDLLTSQFGSREHQFIVDHTTYPVKSLKPLLTDSSKLFLLHNAKHDLQFYLHHGIDIKKVYDTFLAECILTTGIENRRNTLGLKDVAKKYCGADLDKEVRGVISKEGLTDRVIFYASDDVKYLQDVKQQQVQQLVEWNMANPEDTQDKYTVLGLENRVVRVFAHLEYTGVKIDTKKWKKNSQEIREKAHSLQQTLDDIVKNEPKLDKFVPKTQQGNLFGYEERLLNINYGSPAQKVDILTSLGLDTDTSADRFLQKNQDFHEFIPTLRDYNAANKLDSSFSDDLLKLLNPKTGRFHPDVWQIISTGRISVSEPNVNQIPRKGEFGPKIRSAFVPKDGYKIVGGDYGAFELRLLAQFSQDPLWLDIFNNGKDLHTVLCMETFDIPRDKVRTPYPVNPDITYRDVQKTINYGLSYGMSAYKLADTMKCSPKEAQKVIDGFFSKVPEVKKTLNYFAKFGTQKGYITTAPPYRRRRRFEGAFQARKENIWHILGAIERKSKNTPIQGTNGDLIKLALINIYDLIQSKGYPVNIILSVYDEIQTEVREDFAEEWSDILEEEMKKAGRLTLKDVPCEVDCDVNDYWDH